MMPRSETAATGRRGGCARNSGRGRVVKGKKAGEELESDARREEAFNSSGRGGTRI